MLDYEIRILDPDSRSARIVTLRLASDYLAIRRAHTLTPAMHSFEVWRGAGCIYASHPVDLLVSPASRKGL